MQSTSHGSARLLHVPTGSGLEWGRALKRSPSWILGSSWMQPVGLRTWPTGRNWLILGPPRSGKGASFFVPTLLSAPDQPEPRPRLVVTDPKGELLAIARKRLEAADYRIHVIAFDQPDLSGGFDPLPWLASDQFGGIDYGAAQHLAQTVVPVNPEAKDPFWDDTARTIIAAAVVFATRLGATFADALGLAYQFAMGATGAMAEQAANLRSVDPWAASQLMALAQNLSKDAKLAGNIGATMIAKFSHWTTPAMLSIFSRPGFTWADVQDSDQSHAVFLLAAAHHSAQQAVVVASAIAAAHRIQRRANRLGRPLWLLLDEFANVGAMPNLLDALTSLPGAGVSMALGLQSVPQLDAVYGESRAKVALEAMHGFLAFPGLGYDSARWVSNRLGQETVTTWSRSTAADHSRQWTKGEHQRAVLMPDEVSRIRSGWTVVQRSGYPGLMLQSRVYFRERRFSAESATANPATPRIAAVLDSMRQPVMEPPGAWDLGASLLSRLLPEQAETPAPEPHRLSQQVPGDETKTDLKSLLKGGEEA